MSTTETPPEPGAWAVAVARDVVRVAGPDAISYLQGQCSQDIDALAVATSTCTFVLQPQGKVDAWARITKTAADEFVLDVDAGHGAALLGRLRRFLIRTKAEVDALEWTSVLVRGVDAPRDELAEGVLRVRPLGPAIDGFDLLGPSATIPDGVAVADAAAHDLHRVRHGIPALGRELDERTIPAEIGTWIIEASVSFTKGCYVGQELTARIDSRGGNVPRRLRALVLDAPVDAGTPVTGDGPCGPVTTTAIDPVRGPVALAFCGRAVEVGATVTVGDVAGVVHELPLV